MQGSSLGAQKILNISSIYAWHIVK